MKFKDKFDNVFEDIDSAVVDYCEGRNCEKCVLWCKRTARNNPAEATRLMGYEVVEENKTANLPNPRKCDRCGREFIADYPQYLCPECDEALDKQCAPVKKPRICEVLGVEVGERFELGNTGIVLLVNRDGKIHIGLSNNESKETDMNVNYLVRAINDSSYIIRKPRFTEEELTFMRSLCAVVPQIRLNRSEDGVLYWIGPEDSNEEGYCNNCLPYKLFPSIPPGTSHKLSEIVGGAE